MSGAIRRAGRRIRRAAPWKLLAPLASIFLLWEGMLVLLDERAEPDKHFVSVAAAYIAVGLFAVWRASRGNPYFSPGYRSWLATTPWSIDKPLPFGPIELDWPDVVVLVGLMALNAVNPGHESAKILALFFFFHGLSLIPSIYGAANHVPAYSALFGLGLMARLWPRPWASALTGAVVYLIVYDGLRLTLARFPRPEDVKAGEQALKFDPETAPCGWPYDRLLREPEQAPGGRHARSGGISADGLEKIPRHVFGGVLDYLMWSLLLGWWLSCLGPLLAAKDRYSSFLLVVGAGVTVGSLILRTGIYAGAYLTPITLWGRIRTFRWIIPGYDVVLLAPLAIPLVALATFVGCVKLDAPWQAAAPTAIGATLFIALAMPPGLRRWRLVGRHRMAAGRPVADEAAS